MIKHKYLIRSGFLVAFLIIVIQFYFINKSNSESQISEKEEKVELAELMFHNQRFMDKLYFSGTNGNWQAAAFYHHEIEENMEVLLEGNIIEDGIEISKLADAMYNPASTELKNGIDLKNQEAFLKGYKTMVNSCNNCHVASKFGFIKVTIPTSPAFTNQEY